MDDGSGRMFDGIALRYDLLNKLISLGLDGHWRQLGVKALALTPGHRVLDLATGTGDLALLIATTEPRASIVGVDPSAEMLNVARNKINTHGLGSIELKAGTGESLPAEEGEFDSAIIGFGIRNFPDRTAALSNLFRCLKPTGRLVILELSIPRGSGLFARLARLHINLIVPLIGTLLAGTAYRYLRDSIHRFPTPDAFADEIRRAGFRQVSVRPLTFGAVSLFLAHK